MTSIKTPVGQLSRHYQEAITEVLAFMLQVKKWGLSYNWCPSAHSKPVNFIYIFLHCFKSSFPAIKFLVSSQEAFYIERFFKYPEKYLLGHVSCNQLYSFKLKLLPVQWWGVGGAWGRGWGWGGRREGLLKWDSSTLQVNLYSNIFFSESFMNFFGVPC